jgi:alkanesulfonate monooxygenase SsuD/methylene tetrahydromethanopterin reductase-like flavin-dependent oxidoreductase (luciferase family)
MRLGVGPLPLDSPADLRALAQAAVESSFDCVWVDGPPAAAAMVAQWVPIRVGAMVDVGVHHPLHLAEDIAVADLTCAGRLEVLLRPAHDDPGVVKEHLHVLAAALSGAHIQWEGLHLRVPARLADNGPVPQRLALNPRPMQPAVPAWVLDAERASFASARRWSAGMRIGRRSHLPELVLCRPSVEASELLEAAGEEPAYFLIAAATPTEVRAAGRRLAGPLRMPEFPDWVSAV